VIVFKRDPIFWWAIGTFVAGIILAIMGYEMAVVLIVGAYLIRPTLHAFDLAERFEDERQIINHSRAGNIAFIVTMLTVIGLALAHTAKGEDPDYFHLILVFGIAARAVTGLLLHGDLRKTGSWMIILVGLVFTVFALATARFSITALFVGLGGLVFSSLGFLARKYPRVISLIAALIAVIFIVQLKLYLIGEAKGGMLIVIAFILFASGCLFIGSRPDSNSESGSRKTAMKFVLGAGSALVLIVLISLGVKAHNPVVRTAGGDIITGPIEVQELSCVAPVKFHYNGKLRSCILALDDTLSGQPFPEGTRLAFTENGDLWRCYLSKDSEIHGYLCKGEKDGFRILFYSVDRLKRIWLARDEVIDGVPCAKYTYLSRNDVSFHENGKLESCKLSEDFSIGEHNFKKGDNVKFDDKGNVVLDE
jgi:hypothetical protein